MASDYKERKLWNNVQCLLTEVRGSNSIVLEEEETRLFKDGFIFLEGEITDEKALSICRQLMILNKDPKVPVIKLILNTPGGGVNPGLAIYDAVTASPKTIDIIVMGKAYSMGAIILAGGQDGHRLILPHSEIMIHEPLIISQVGGSASSIKSTSDILQQVKEKIVDILVLHTGRSKREVSRAMSYDHFMSAEEALAFGLVDAMVDFSSLMQD